MASMPARPLPRNLDTRTTPPPLSFRHRKMKDHVRGDRRFAEEQAAAAAAAGPQPPRTRRSPQRLSDEQEPIPEQLLPHEKPFVTAAEQEELAKQFAQLLQAQGVERIELDVRGNGQWGEKGKPSNPSPRQQFSALRPSFRAAAHRPPAALRTAGGRRPDGPRAAGRGSGPERRRQRSRGGAAGQNLRARRRPQLAGAVQPAPRERRRHCSSAGGSSNAVGQLCHPAVAQLCHPAVNLSLPGCRTRASST